MLKHKKTIKTVHSPLRLILNISLSSIGLLSMQPSLAQTPPVPQPSEAPLELSLIVPARIPNQGVITSNTISQQGLTIPSLWWAKEQFGDKLLDNWLAHPPTSTTDPHIDLIVNRQIWSILDYLERYEFVTHFGTVAQDYGYNIRVFNYQAELLASYTCNFDVAPRQCSIALDSTGKSRVRWSNQE